MSTNLAPRRPLVVAMWRWRSPSRSPPAAVTTTVIGGRCCPITARRYATVETR